MSVGGVPAGGVAPAGAPRSRPAAVIASHANEVGTVQGKVRAAEAALTPLQQKLRGLEAAQEAAGAELAAARADADRWQKRAQQLMQKYESVDAGEYQRVTAELKTVQEAAKAAEETAAERGRELAAARQALAAAEARATAAARSEGAEKAAQAQLTKIKADLDAARAEAETQRKKAAGLWTAVVTVCNRDKKPVAEWKVLQAEKERRLVELEEKAKLAEAGGGDGGAAAELPALRARVAQLEGEVAAAETKAKSEIAAAKSKGLDVAKKAMASKQAVDKELERIKAALAAAQQSAAAATARLNELTAERDALQETVKGLQSQLATAKAAAAAAAKQAAPQRAAAAREAAKTQIAAIQQQAMAEVKTRLKRKTPAAAEAPW